MGRHYPPWCIICGRPRQRYRRCETCRIYREKFQRERPARLWDWRLQQPVAIPTAESGCPDCGTEHGLRADGLCRACAISRELGA